MTAAKAAYRNGGGSSGRGAPVEKSQSSWYPWKVDELTLRDALLAILTTSGQDPWAADSTEMSTPAVRKMGVGCSRLMTAAGGRAHTQ